MLEVAAAGMRGGCRASPSSHAHVIVFSESCCVFLGRLLQHACFACLRTALNFLLPWLPPMPCSPSETQAAAGSGDGTVFLWDVSKATVASRLRNPKHHHLHHHSAVACAWCPLGLPLVACDKAGNLSFWSSSERPAASPRIGGR
jgi:hypothetical protein